jgi:uncharacterized protein (TIGR02145 family)
MKKFSLLLTTIFMSLSLLAQAPAGINYQTVIRDGDGNILPDTEISLQMTIRTGAPDGAVVYQETHDATTNAFGLVSLVIGYGNPQSGTFVDVNWGDGEKYLETAVDMDGGGTYTVLGVTQFLSVPFSKMADLATGVQSMTTAERDAMQNPPVGMAVYNTTSNCLNYFNGTSWFETCGDCTPMPSQANAGPNQYFNDETVATNLEGNTPEFGTGSWSVVSGTGGTFDNANDSTTLFTGQACETYTLKWTIANPCGSTSDNVNIQFDTQPTTANAGTNQHFLDNTTSTTLEGNTPVMGEGLWTIQSGQGGSFANAASPTTGFTGQQCETYVLRWTISTPCHTSWDEVIIDFDNTPTVANAGSDQWYVQGTSTTLQGNSPANGLGYWSIVSGSGGTIQFPTNPTSVFIGQQGVVYELKWTISTECNSSSDNMNIYFGDEFQCGLPLIDDRDDQQYETVQIGDQCWMAENLNIGTRINGSSNQSDNGTIEKYCYNNADAQCDTYGGLYQWDEMMGYTTTPGVQGICPEGWHLPSDAEWTTLTTYLGGESVAGGKMKETGTTYWNSPNTGATNSSGFTALPGGGRNTNGSFSGVGNEGYWWSSSEIGASGAWNRSLYYGSAQVYRYSYGKSSGFSVRCLKDN